MNIELPELNDFEKINKIENVLNEKILEEDLEI